MMRHEVITIRQIAADATAKHIQEDDNRDLIRTDFDKEITAAIESGELAEPVPTIRELRRSWAWGVASAQANAIGKRIRKALSHGESMLEFEEESLDCMVVICDKRRSTVRLMTADDLALMAQESKENRKKIDQADDDLQAGIADFVKTLRQYANYGDYLQRMRGAAA